MKTEKRIRETLGVTQEAFAHFLGISCSQLGMVEIGQRHLPDEAASAVSYIKRLLCKPQEERQAMVEAQMREANRVTLQKCYDDSTYRLKCAQIRLEKMKETYQQCVDSLYMVQQFTDEFPETKRNQILGLEIVALQAKKRMEGCSKAQQHLLQLKINTLEVELNALQQMIATL